MYKSIIMKRINLFLLIATALIAIMSCENYVSDNDARPSGGNGTQDEGSEMPYEGIVVTLPEWTETKSYSRGDLTVPEMNPGEKVAVVNREGDVMCFTVVESKNNKAYLQNPDIEIVDGAEYRIQYPYPEGWDQKHMLVLGFGDYTGPPTLDWMVSKWKKYKKNKEFNFNLKRVNGVLIFDMVAPFDCVVEEVRLSSDKADFCVKGAFDCSGDDIVPDRTTWISQFPFPYRDNQWTKGEIYTLILTVWPHDYSGKEYALDVYTTDDRGFTTQISIPEIKEGKIKEYEIDDWTILTPPVYKKDAIEEERDGDVVQCVREHQGEGFRF